MTAKPQREQHNAEGRSSKKTNRSALNESLAARLHIAGGALAALGRSDFRLARENTAVVAGTRARGRRCCEGAATPWPVLREVAFESLQSDPL